MTHGTTNAYKRAAAVVLQDRPWDTGIWRCAAYLVAKAGTSWCAGYYYRKAFEYYRDTDGR